MIIYKITNALNGMAYVGQTTRTIKRRVYEHRYKNSLIGKAIKVLGEENFTFEVLEVCKNKEELNEKERYWIEHLNLITPNGYNKAVVDSKFGEHNGFFGKTHDAKTIEKGRLNQPNRKMVRCIDTGEMYVSVRECERLTGTPRTRIINLCKGRTGKTKGLRFEYVS